MGFKRVYGRFYLEKKPYSEGNLPLMFEFSHRGSKSENGTYRQNRLRHYSGLRVPGKTKKIKAESFFSFWDDKNQIARGFRGADDINTYIVLVQTKIAQYLRAKRERFEPLDLVELKNIISVNRQTSSLDLISYCGEYVKRYNKPVTSPQQIGQL